MAYRKTSAVQERLDASRSRIVSSALDLVADRGYSGCSMAEVATAAGVGVGTVYRFFPGKGELFAEVFRDACSREVAASTAAGARAAQSGSSADAALASVTTFAERALRAPTLAYALLVEPVDVLVDTERLAFRESFTELLAAAIHAGITEGELPQQNSTVTAACIVGAIGEALVLPLARGTADPQIVDALETFTRRALGSAPSDRRPS